jgi:hypothetical protein
MEDPSPALTPRLGVYLMQASGRSPALAAGSGSRPMAGVLSLAEFFSEENVRRITSQAEAAAHT